MEALFFLLILAPALCGVIMHLRRRARERRDERAFDDPLASVIHVPEGPYRGQSLYAPRTLRKPEPERPKGLHAKCAGRGRWWFVRFDENHAMYICDGCAKSLAPDVYAAGFGHLVAHKPTPQYPDTFVPCPTCMTWYEPTKFSGPTCPDCLAMKHKECN